MIEAVVFCVCLVLSGSFLLRRPALRHSTFYSLECKHIQLLLGMSYMRLDCQLIDEHGFLGEMTLEPWCYRSFDSCSL